MKHTWTAKWIWWRKSKQGDYNRAAVFEKTFLCRAGETGKLRITVDSRRQSLASEYAQGQRADGTAGDL